MDIEARLEYIIFENKANHYVVAGFSELKTYHNFTAVEELKIQSKIKNMFCMGNM